jgi:hypothetical protein
MRTARHDFGMATLGSIGLAFVSDVVLPVQCGCLKVKHRCYMFDALCGCCSWHAHQEAPVSLRCKHGLKFS